MQKLVYSTVDLPPDYDDQARMAHWQEFSAAIYGSLDCTRPDDRPFSVDLSFLQIGPVGFGSFFGTVRDMCRSRGIDADGNFTLFINRSEQPLLLRDGPRETPVAPDSIALLEGLERNGIASGGDIACMSLHFPRRSLLELVPNAPDRLCEGLAADALAVRHLNRYLDFVRTSGEIDGSPQLLASVATTLVDLVALAVGADRDAAELATGRGLRAARIQDILRILQSRFFDPAFSASEVAARLGVTPRYVQQLLQEAGSTFSERVLELRLQKSRTMLADPRRDHLRVGEIALACGFSDASYFNRCFRQRFGATPTQYRGAGAQH